MYGRKKTGAVTLPIFTKTHQRSARKLTTVQQHYVQFSYAEFHSKRTINLENMGRNVFMARNVVWVLLGRLSQNLTLARQIFVKKFHAHSTPPPPKIHQMVYLPILGH
jgi:hypothetical protein